MPDRYLPHFLTTELDPALLSTPFKVKTNWHVITGAPSSGKTTLINRINNMGYKTSPERARQYIEREMAKGYTVDEVQADKVALEQAIMSFTLNSELQLAASDVIFLDRGVPDCLGYCRIIGLNPNDSLPDCFHHRYASVFILDRLPFDHDGVRYEDDTIAAFLHTWTLNDYQALGYNPISVPILPVEERVEFILNKLTEQKLI